MNAPILALGLYKESGGVNKCVRAFQRALNAQVISWVDPVQVREQQLIWSDSTVVHGSRLPVLRQMLYPASGETIMAEQILAKADIVMCHSFWRWHNPWLRRIARTRSVPYWFVPHGGLDPYVFQTGRWAKKLFLRCVGTRFIREAACVIFSTRREMEKAAPWCPARRTEIIYWPLEDQDFAMVWNKELGRTVREQYGIPPNQRCLLYFGRLHPMKRPLETIDAVSAAGRDDVHLLIVGNEFGVSLPECRQRAEQQGMADRVHVVGPVYGQKVAAYLWPPTPTSSSFGARTSILRRLKRWLPACRSSFPRGMTSQRN